jgi:release factor glutamine methyltransferase
MNALSRSAFPAFPAVVAALRAAGCVFAEDEAELLLAAARCADELDHMIERRVAGHPLEHVVGWAEFCGLRIVVDPGVFVPRRRTEFLARQALGLARTGAPVIDLCCGSGALGAVLAAAVELELHAADIDPAATACAARNLADRGTVWTGDLFEPLPAELRGRVRLLIANVPYVPTDRIALLPAEAREHEARVALDGGPDGLGVLRRVAAEAPRWLAPGGSLLFETSERQLPSAVEVVVTAGLSARVATDDELDATVVIATRP